MVFTATYMNKLNMDKDYIINLRNELLSLNRNTEYISLCIDYAERLLNQNLPVIFDYLHFCDIFHIESKTLKLIIFNQNCFYTAFKIRKKNGRFRELNIPSYELKKIQRWILDKILYNMPISKSAFGFVKEKSIVDNARLHLNRDFVMNLDIKDFFPSIGFKQVFDLFYSLGYTKEVSFILTKICTFNNKLPQGSPASPFISNLICRNLDLRLNMLAISLNAQYSRYADDISFSSSYNLKKLIPLISTIIKDEGFEINGDKTRILQRNQSMNVTGIIVNGKELKVKNNYKKEIFKEIYFCKKFGVISHLERTNNVRKFYKEHLYGKAYFIKMIELETGYKILNLLDSIEWDY